MIAAAVKSNLCDGVFCRDRNLRISHLVDSEYRLAHDLAAVRQLLPLALGQPRETGCQRDHHRLEDEHRRLCKAIRREDWRAA